jgi:hypothetical protein
MQVFTARIPPPPPLISHIGGSSLVSCPRLLFHYTHRCPPYLEAVPSMRTRNSAVLWSPLNLEPVRQLSKDT